MKNGKSKNGILPTNRRRQILYVIKKNWVTLVLCGVFTLLFSLPLHASAIYDDLYSNMLIGQFQSGAITADEQTALYATFSHIRWLCEIVFYVIMAVGLAGIIRVIRQLAYGKQIKFFSDFTLGVKQNSLQYIAVAVVFAAIRVAVLYCVSTPSARILGDILFGYSALFLFPLGLFLSSVIAVYSNGLFGNLKTAFSVFVRSFFKTLGVMLLLAIPFVFQMVPYFGVVVHIVSRAVTSLAFGIISFIWIVFSLSRFDALINIEQYPELYRIGLADDTKYRHRNRTEQTIASDDYNNSDEDL